MALKLMRHSRYGLVIAAGYEGGFIAVRPVHDPAPVIYISQPHSQPVLSIDALPNGSAFFSSSADSVIAAHRLPDRMERESRRDSICSGQRTFSSFLDKAPTAIENRPSFLSSGLILPSPHQSATSGSRQGTFVPFLLHPPRKSKQTGHAGQQSLRVRCDGRILATGGWDSRIRVYSTKTLKEVAVLKWHKEGVFAVAFGSVGDEPEESGSGENEKASKATSMLQTIGLGCLQKQRAEQLQKKHWIAAGAKDGKVSLWEIY